MPLAFDKKGGRSFNCRKFFVSLRKVSQFKQFKINMHSYKVFKKAWYAWHATHFKAYAMHDVQTTAGRMDGIK